MKYFKKTAQLLGLEPEIEFLIFLNEVMQMKFIKKNYKKNIIKKKGKFLKNLLLRKNTVLNERKVNLMMKIYLTIKVMMNKFLNALISLISFAETDKKLDVDGENTISGLTGRYANTFAFVYLNSSVKKIREPEHQELLIFRKRYEEEIKKQTKKQTSEIPDINKILGKKSEMPDIKEIIKEMMKKTIKEAFVKISFPENTLEIEMIIKAIAIVDRKLHEKHKYVFGLSACIQYKECWSAIVYRYVLEYGNWGGKGKPTPWHEGDKTIIMPFITDSERLGLEEEITEMLKNELELLTGNDSERIYNNTCFVRPTDIINEAAQNDYIFYNKNMLAELIKSDTKSGRNYRKNI